MEGKNCGMAEGCYGLNQADGCISVAALRPPCQGKAHRGPAPMTRRLAQLNAATQVRVPGNTARPSSQYCNNVLKNVKIPIKYIWFSIILIWSKAEIIFAKIWKLAFRGSPMCWRCVCVRVWVTLTPASSLSEYIQQNNNTNTFPYHQSTCSI